MASTDELVAEYVRATMRVEPPPSLNVEVMRSVTAIPQERRGWLSTFGPYMPAMVAVAAAGLIIAIGSLITSPRDVGPAEVSPDPTAVPAPTLTPEDARILTAPGDVIRIPAFDSQGQFGVIRLERGDEFGSYPDYMPVAAMGASNPIFFVEVHVTYEVDRATADQYGNIDFGWAVDADGDGLDEDDEITQHIGYDVDGALLETGPSPLLPFVNGGPEEMTGWIPFELPAAGAEYDIYLVQLADLPDQPGPVFPGYTVTASALLREPAEPVGVTTFDWESLPPRPSGAPDLNLQRLPTPAPSPAGTFEPLADAEVDALFAETRTCVNPELDITVTFPSSWHTHDTYQDLPQCTFFNPEPFDAAVEWNRLTTNHPAISLFRADSWIGGATDQPNVPQARFARVPIGDRVAWMVTYEFAPDAAGYLLPLTDDPYGPFVRAGGVERAVLERMLLLIEFNDRDAETP